MKKFVSGTTAFFLAMLVTFTTFPNALAADKCQKGHRFDNHICVVCGEYDANYTGLLKSEKNELIYVENGVFNSEYCGLARGDEGTFLVKNGVYNSSVNGLVKISEGNLMTGKWVYLVDGQTEEVDADGNYVSLFSDAMAKNDYGWWYIKNGTIDFSYTGLSENQYGIYYIVNGKYDNKVNGLIKVTDGSVLKGQWVYLVNGQFAKKNNGEIIPIYSGMAKNDYGWWYVKNGEIDFTFKGLAKNSYGWWYLRNGKLDRTFNGSAKNPYGWWYVVNGKVNTAETGTVTIKKGSFRMNKGKVSRIMLDVPYVNQCPDYPTGCEAASAAMLLKYNGINITLNKMIDAIPRENLHKENGRMYGPSINEKFVGDPRKTYTSDTPGYGAFSPVVTKSINSVLTKNKSRLQAYNITGTKAGDLFAYIGEGKPVIVWATFNMMSPSTVNEWYIKTENGDEYFSYPRGTHVMVLTGFDSDYVYVSDPYNQGVVKFSKSAFTNKYNLLGKQAIVIE